MIRKSLYLAASAAVLITATQAQAADLTGTGIFSGVTTVTGTSTAYMLAEELTYYTAFSSASAAAATKGAVTFALQPDATFTTGESLLLTIDMTGGVFSGSGLVITTGSVTGTTCIVDSVVPVTPATSGSATAEYLVALDGTCNTGNGFSISAPVQVLGNLNIGAKLQQSFGGQLINVDGGRVSARFVTVAPAFSAEIEASSATVTALVSEGYRELNNASATVGSVAVAVDSDVNVDMAGTSASASNVESVVVTVNAATGSFTGYNLEIAGGNAFTAGTTTATSAIVRIADLEDFVGSANIVVVDNTATATNSGINMDAVIQASTFSATVAVELSAGLTGLNETGSLAPVTRDGTSFVAPWIALGAASANSTIRLANNGSTDTGPIQMTLTSSNGSAAPIETVTISASELVSGSLTAQGGIPAGGVVSISGAALKTAFGTTAANGDLEVTIEAQPQFISGKVRVTQASGQIFETSLGNLRGDN